VNLSAKKKASIHSSSTILLSSYFELEYYPNCIRDQFKSILIQVINELMNVCMMNYIDWVEKRMRQNTINPNTSSVA
jgi:hypothetical protein